MILSLTLSSFPLLLFLLLMMVIIICLRKLILFSKDSNVFNKTVISVFTVVYVLMSKKEWNAFRGNRTHAATATTPIAYNRTTETTHIKSMFHIYPWKTNYIKISTLDGQHKTLAGISLLYFLEIFWFGQFNPVLDKKDVWILLYMLMSFTYY